MCHGFHTNIMQYIQLCYHRNKTNTNKKSYCIVLYYCILFLKQMSFFKLANPKRLNNGVQNRNRPNERYSSHI